MTEYRHRHHGLTIAADVELPMPAGDAAGSPDLTIHVKRAARPPMLGQVNFAVRPGECWRETTARGSRVRLRSAGTDGTWVDFLIDERGTHLTMTLSHDADLAEASELLAGNVFSCVLAQLGWTCLHACAVELAGGAVAIVGAKSAGKSSLALALAGLGVPFLSDDVVPFQPTPAGFEVTAGRPSVRVTRQTATAVGVEFDTLQPIWDERQPRPPKRFAQIARPASQPTVTLRGIVLLADRGSTARPDLTRVSPTQLLLTLIANRHMGHVLDPARRKRDFVRLGSVSESVTAYELRRPDDVSLLPATAHMIAGVFDL